MKRLVLAFTVVVLILSSSIVSHGAQPLGIMLDGSPIAFNESTGYPFIDANGRTLVPFRQTMESAGYTVSWDSINKVAAVWDSNGTKVYIKIGDNYITKEITSNGSTESSRLKNDTFAQIVNSRTYLPIRIVFEAFGANVTWDGLNKNVVINTSGISSSTLSAEQIYSKYSSSVFYIEIYDKNGAVLGSGSGFFIDSNGTAITNYHVIKGAYSAKISTTSGKTYSVDGVLDYDELKDIAKIKINGNGFPFVNINASPSIVGGSPAYAIGSPLGLDNTITEGIISNPNRIIDGMSYYQISTPISPGSSGGALFDENGRVIGITSGGYVDGQNLNVAIPIENIYILTGTKVQSLSAIAEQYNTQSDTNPGTIIDTDPYYDGYYPAPNFGYIFGVPVYYDYSDSNGIVYDYALADIYEISPDGDYIDYYSDCVISSGFYFDNGFYDDDGNYVMTYMNYSYGLTLYTAVTELEGVPCYTVMVIYQ